jgi:primosomal protein N'
MAKLRGRHRRHILLRSRVMKTLVKVLHPLIGKIPRQKSVRVTIDVDALNLL